jgi:hypothetical protein
MTVPNTTSSPSSSRSSIAAMLVERNPRTWPTNYAISANSWSTIDVLNFHASPNLSYTITSSASSILLKNSRTVTTYFVKYVGTR